VFFIEVLTGAESDKELGLVGIFTRIGHCEDSSFGKFKSLVELILERSIVNRLPSHASARGISTLDHKARDETMENGIGVISFETVLDEIFRG
jgi:hypothetical protein